jgi:hypothetical protein
MTLTKREAEKIARIKEEEGQDEQIAGREGVGR